MGLDAIDISKPGALSGGIGLLLLIIGWLVVRMIHAWDRKDEDKEKRITEIEKNHCKLRGEHDVLVNKDRHHVE